MINNRSEENKIEISMPKICARCGQEPVASVWPIYSKYGHAFFIILTTYKTLTFFVPVCQTCKTQLSQDSKKWFRILVLSLVGSVIILCSISQFVGHPEIFYSLIVLAAISVAIATIKYSKYWSGSGIASYNGKYFTFTNKNFRERFSELNPSFVRKW